VTFYNRTGSDVFFHTNCGCTQRYKGLELTVSKRMSNRWQMLTSYVWSRLDGDLWSFNATGDALVLDPTDPNNLTPAMKSGRGPNDQPRAFKILGSYQAPWGITLGGNYQALSGLPRDRVLSVTLVQGIQNLLVEPRGTYRSDSLNLVSLRADKGFRINGPRRVSVIAEVHNLINSSAGSTGSITNNGAYGIVTRGYQSQAAFDAARLTGASYFGRVQEIIAPRIIKLGVKIEF
jgi:hypothetical protein